MNGLSIVDLKPLSLADRLLRRKPKENALLEIQNYLASTPIAQTSRQTISDLLDGYEMEWFDLQNSTAILYTQVLRHFAQDHELSSQELADLKHLQQVLGLSDKEIRTVEATVLLPIYDNDLKRALNDYTLSEVEKDYLKNLAQRLHLSGDRAKGLYKTRAEEVVQAALDQAISDRKLSPDEETELRKIAQNLGGQLDCDDATASALDRFRLFWRISQGDIPEQEVSIRLQRGERCYAYLNASHYEYRAVTRSIRYGGVGASFRICKGIYLRGGVIKPTRTTEDVLKLLDSGTLYFTNKRLIFDGSNKTTSIKLDKILNYSFLQDGIVIEKETGKDQLFEFSSDIELLAVIMDSITAQK